MQWFLQPKEVKPLTDVWARTAFSYRSLLMSCDRMRSLYHRVGGDTRQRNKKARVDLLIYPSLYHPNSIAAKRRWGPTRWGGAGAPYKCFRLRRKPWRRRN